MIARFFNRQAALAAPFLAAFFFPIAALAVTGLFHKQVDWNGDLLGLLGDASKPPLPLTWKTWWSGDFQKSFASWWEYNCPNRSFLIRLFGQVDYTCLRSTCMLQNGLVIGPEGQLDLKSHVLIARRQMSYPPDRTARIMGKIEHLQALLRQQGKSFFVLTTPIKPSTYPASVPGRFLAYDDVQSTAYDDLIQALQHSDIPFVDGARIIHELAPKSPYPLFLQGGIHWDSYATAQVLPAFSQEVTRLTGKPFPIPTITGVRLVKAKLALNHADHDLASLLNLLSRPFSYLSPQVDLKYAPPSPLAAQVVVAGGSFDWNLLTELGGTNGESGLNLPFAYYGRAFYDVAWAFPVSQLNYERDLAGCDLVVLELNEPIPESTMDALLPMVEASAKITNPPERVISFAQGGDSDEFISRGFGHQEPTLRRTEGEDAILVLPLPPHLQDYTLTAQVRPCLDGGHPSRKMDIFLNDVPRGQREFTHDAPDTVIVPFTASGVVRVRFHFPELAAAKSPAQSAAADPALAFYSVQVSPAKTVPRPRQP